MCGNYEGKGSVRDHMEATGIVNPSRKVRVPPPTNQPSLTTSTITPSKSNLGINSTLLTSRRGLLTKSNVTNKSLLGA